MPSRNVGLPPSRNSRPAIVSSAGVAALVAPSSSPAAPARYVLRVIVIRRYASAERLDAARRWDVQSRAVPLRLGEFSGFRVQGSGFRVGPVHQPSTLNHQPSTYLEGCPSGLRNRS